MSKREHTAEWMIARVREYLNGEGSYPSLSKAYGIIPETLRNWLLAYNAYGESAFIQTSVETGDGSLSPSNVTAIGKRRQRTVPCLLSS